MVQSVRGRVNPGYLVKARDCQRENQSWISHQSKRLSKGESILDISSKQEIVKGRVNPGYLIKARDCQRESQSWISHQSKRLSKGESILDISSK
nr:hypothetical protein BgiMline_032485 [Biomphalaria glabrata]